MDADDFRPELIWPYDPRLVPLPAPDVDICAPPVVNVCVNARWWAHISGMISRLTYDDAWTGTEDEIHAAVESIYKILNVGRPTMGCGCGDTGLPSRYNAAGVYQVSYDGGVTWVDAPLADYRNNVVLLPPLPGEDGDDKKCQIATNIRGHIEHQADQLGADTAAWGELTLLIAAFIGLMIFVGIIGSLGAATPLILALAGALLTVGQSGFAAAMTTAVFDTFECLLYCNMQDDGTFTDADLTTIKAGIASDIGGVAQTYLLGVMDALGTTGLENMGRTGSGLAADCSGCPCSTDCNLSNWSVIPGNGTEIDRGADYITVESQASGMVGGQAAGIYTGDNMVCCFLTVKEFLSGGATGQLHVRCGETIPPFDGTPWPHTGDPGTESACAIVNYSTSTFTVKYTLSGVYP